MTTQTEALNVALDALRNSQDYKMGRVITVEAVEIIEEALANHIEDNLVMVAQQSNEQVEPVAWSITYHGSHCNNLLSNKMLAEVELKRLNDEYGPAGRTLIPLYTHPPVPTAQPKPLTDEQIKKDFEKWAKENYSQGFEPYGDSYHNGHTRNRWQGWLAAHRAIKATNGIKP